MSRLVYQPKSINNDVIPGNLVVNGDLTVDDDLIVTDDGSFGGDLAVTGIVTAADLTLSDDLIVGDDAQITGDLTVTGTTQLNGAVNFATGSVITLPTNNFLVKRYVSNAITQADLLAGATQTIALVPAFPLNVTPIGGYVVTSVETTSSSGDTTGLTSQIGVATDPNGVVDVVSIFGAAGRKQTTAGGAFLGCLRLADNPLQILLTATGAGAEDLLDINQLSVRAVVYYLEVAAEA